MGSPGPFKGKEKPSFQRKVKSEHGHTRDNAIMIKVVFRKISSYKPPLCQGIRPGISPGIGRRSRKTEEWGRIPGMERHGTHFKSFRQE